MINLSIKIKNYKCFKDEAGFDNIQRVNLIIGKNNAGKSTLLDVVEAVANRQYQFDRATWRENQPPEIYFSAAIPQEAVTDTFPTTTSHGLIPGNHRQYGERLIGRNITWKKLSHGNEQTFLINCDDSDIYPPLSNTGHYGITLASNIKIPLEGKKFRRVAAERDIHKEPDHSGVNMEIHPNGTGITTAIQRFINRSNLPSEIVEVDILNALNEIFSHDTSFTDIVCQLHETNYWEIFLEEKDKGRIALSKSGSGLKTVLTVLTCLFIVPKIEQTNLSDYIFGFEELENNIHPALLRRLNDYIYRSSVKNNFTYFLTTHSNVLIDQFSKQDDAQILHITQTNATSHCSTAKTYVDNNGILDDLDVRASDLLQANGIIWVEGPSDRIYLNRLIQLWSDGALKEGTHYQIIFYGGRLLSHLSANAPGSTDDGISIFNTNRNAIILIDSDRRTPEGRINDTKLRIQREFERLGALCWITSGKEIENYIPSEIINDFLEIENSVKVAQFGSFFEHLDTLKEGEGTKYLAKKSLLAEKLVPYMSRERMQNMYDINTQLSMICERIRLWNT